MFVVDGRHSQKHEDDGLGGRAQHFQAVLQSGLGFGANVPLDVVLHRDAAEGDTGNVNYKR